MYIATFFQVWIRAHPSIRVHVVTCLSRILNEETFRNKIIFSEGGSTVNLNRFTLLGHSAIDILRRVIVVLKPVVSEQEGSSSTKNRTSLTVDDDQLTNVSNRRRKKLLQQARLSESSKQQSNESFFTHILSLHRINQAVWPHGQLLPLQIRDCRKIKFEKAELQRTSEAAFMRESTSATSSHEDVNTGRSSRTDSNSSGGHRYSASSLKHKRKFENMKRNLTPWPSPSQLASSLLFTGEGRALIASRYQDDFSVHVKAKMTAKETTSSSSSKSTKLSSPAHGNNEHKDDESTTIPIVLIRKDPPALYSSTSRNKKSLGNNSNNNRGVLPMAVVGWDIVVPEQWGPSLWRALIFAGATAVGVEELDRLHLLSAQSSFPRDFPDTPAGSHF